jgi:hypothetical protein
MCQITALSEESLFHLISLIAPSMTKKVREEAYRDFIKEFENRVNSKDISEKLFETECILLERDKNEID